jgi:hypothetical protein
MHHTVPAALFAWLAHPTDARAAIEEVVLLGGDTDSTGAVVGALAGARLGDAALPREWLAGLADWPRTIAWIRRLAAALVDGGRPPRAPFPFVLARNLAFLAVALGHGLRRLLPPYR